jgi:glycosyltransferase involved in cell wall biosynthesis
VLFFRPALGDGGADRVTLTLLQHLDRTRYSPSLALVARKGALIDEVPTDVEVIDLGASRLATAVLPLSRLIATRSPDVVFCTASSANVIAVAAHALARSRARLVLSERSTLKRSDRTAARNFFELRAKAVAYQRADAITAVSDGVAADLVQLLGVSPQRIVTVYNPVVDEATARRASEPVDHRFFAEDVPVLIAVGRLVAIKDYPTLLRAFALIRQQLPVKLLILGQGEARSSLEQLTRELQLAAEVDFLGFDRNPLKYLARAHLLLQASRAEGLPGTLIQSLAVGTPVVATDCDHGPREVIRHRGDGGILVPVGNAQALADAALLLLRDHALRDELATVGRRSSQRFSLASSLRHYEAALSGAP